MQVSVEVTQGLGRRITIGVPKERVNGEVDNRLKSLARTSHMKGFRPGKVPVRVIQQRYGIQVRQEVLREMVEHSFQEAVDQEKLKPAGMPQIELLHGMESADEDFSYTADFEVYPEIQAVKLDGVQVEKLSAKVTDSDLEKMLASLRQQRRIWHDETRPAQMGDLLTLEYTATVDGVGDTQTQTVVLGEKHLFAEFENSLVGAGSGQKLELNLHFPQDHPRADMAGKPVHIAVSIQRVASPQVPEIDADFIKSFGVEGDVESFRAEIRKNMQRELDGAIKARLKQQILDTVLAANDIEVPKVLVETEAHRLMQKMQADLESQGISHANLPLRPDVFMERALKRVKLGLLINELVRSHQLQAKPEKVKEMVEHIAATYENPQAVARWFYSNQQRLAEVEATVLEDQVIEWLLENVGINEKTSSFDEIMNRIAESLPAVA